jgi:hypothetical protein
VVKWIGREELGFKDLHEGDRLGVSRSYREVT